MSNPRSIKIKLIRAFMLLGGLLSSLSCSTGSSVKNSRHNQDNKTGKKIAATVIKTPALTSANVVAEQDPDGIFWGLRDTVTKKLVLGYTYQEIWDFDEGFATVELNDKYGLISRAGKVIIEPLLDDDVIVSKCGFVKFEVGYGPVSIIDSTGKLVIDMASGVTYLPCQQRITSGYNAYRMMNFKKDTILPFKFREARLLPEGFCVASSYDNDKYGMYDLDGKPVLPHAFEMIDDFYSGRALVRKAGKYGIIDETGKELFYTDYGRIDRFEHGYALVYTDPKFGEIKVGIIDKNGRPVVPAIYQWLEQSANFSDGLAAMALNRKYGFVNEHGKVIVDFKYNQVESFEKGIAKVWTGWQHTGYINTSGKEIIAPTFDPMDQANLRRYCHKFIIGLKDSVQHVFDYSGKEIALLKYTTVGVFNEKDKSFIVSANHRYGVLDSNFQVKIPLKYQSLQMIFPGRIAATEQSKIGFIDLNGNALSDIKYDTVEPFPDDKGNAYANGLAKVRIKGKKGVINSSGKTIIPVIYDEIAGFYYGFAIVKRNHKYGFVNAVGKEVIPAIYNKAAAFDGFTARVTLKGKTFEIDSTGKRMPDEDSD